MYKCLIFFLLFFTTLSASNPSAFILAAGNLKFVFPQMIQEFYKKYPDASVHIQYGASGYLAESILKGKKYDIFFSADRKYPQKVYDAKRSERAPKNYAQGILILLSPIDISLADNGLKVLNNKKIKNIIVANKTHSPYGVATMEVLQHSKCCKTTIKKIRYSLDLLTVIDNVIWNGDAGFLAKSALSLIPEDKRKEGVDWIELDETLYSPIIQSYVVSQEGMQNQNAKMFLHFIESNQGQAIFIKNGYKNINLK